MKKTILLLYVFILLPGLTACWNYREVERLTIVEGFAIDKAENGNYLLTFEVVDFQGATEGHSIKPVLIKSEGESIISAIRNTINKNFPKLYFGHTTILILSQEVAKDGVLKVIDFIFRDVEPRLNIDILISKDEKAGEILSAKALTSELLSLEITNILEEEKHLSKALSIPAYEFINALAGEGVSAVMTSVCTETNNEEKVVRLCGTAIFKEDKLQGFIDDNDTFVLSFIRDEVKGGVIVANVGSEIEEEKISMEILTSDTKIEPSFIDDKLSIKVSIDTKVALIEHDATKGNYIDEKGRAILKKITEEQLKNRIESMIKKIQEEFGVDIFGFGNRFYSDLPKVWKEKGENWEQLFKDLDVTVETNIDIKHTGLLSKPIKIGD